MTISHLLRTNVVRVGLPNSEGKKKNTGYSFKFELQPNNEEYFSTL